MKMGGQRVEVLSQDPGEPRNQQLVSVVGDMRVTCAKVGFKGHVADIQCQIIEPGRFFLYGLRSGHRPERIPPIFSGHDLYLAPVEAMLGNDAHRTEGQLFVAPPLQALELTDQQSLG